jgi:hypothetical protein
MTDPMIPTTTRPRAPASSMARLRRAFMRPPRQGTPTRRVWQEVAPGEWRWVHVDAQGRGVQSR